KDAEAPKPKAEPRPEKPAGRGSQVRLAAPVPEPEPEAAEPEEEVQEILPPRPAATRSGGRALPSIVARAEAVKGRAGSTAFGLPQEKPYDAPRRGPTLEPRRDGPRLEPAARISQAAVARQEVPDPEEFDEPQQVAAAMSA